MDPVERAVAEAPELRDTRPHWQHRALMVGVHHDRRRRASPIDRTIEAWPTVASVLYFVFGLMTMGIGVIFAVDGDEVRKFGFAFMGSHIADIGPPLAVLGLLQMVTTPLRFLPVKWGVAAISVSFYASISTHSASPTACWIYGCIGLCHVLICTPRER